MAIHPIHCFLILLNFDVEATFFEFRLFLECKGISIVFVVEQCYSFGRIEPIHFLSPSRKAPFPCRHFEALGFDACRCTSHEDQSVKVTPIWFHGPNKDGIPLGFGIEIDFREGL